MDLHPQTFEANAVPVLNECIELATTRGAEYQDSWHLDNQVTTFLDATLRRLGIDAPTKEAKRLILLAALIDVKMSRLVGPFKKDTTQDLCNYVAAFTGLREQFEIDRAAESTT